METNAPLTKTNPNGVIFAHMQKRLRCAQLKKISQQ